MLYPSLTPKPFTTVKNTSSLCFELIVTSVYQTIITQFRTLWFKVAQFKTLERSLSKDPELSERHAHTTREDTMKGYVVTVEQLAPRKRSDRERYLLHHPVVNPNKPAKMRRVLNRASKFHATILKKSLLVSPDLLQIKNIRTFATP